MPQPSEHRADMRPLTATQRKMFMSAQQGDAAGLRRVLETGAPVNFVDPTTTDSPLMIACRKGFTDVVRLCLDFGAKNDPHPEFGQTALHAAIASGHIGCAEIILQVAAQSDADHVISNLTDQYGQTPLHCAALMGSVPLAELLLHHGARIDCVDSYGQTPLHLSAASINMGCLALLLDHGGDDVLEVEDVYGNRPLHHAVYHGRQDCAKLLLETAAEVNAQNSKSLTPYNLAVMQGHHQISLLLQQYREGSSAPPTPARSTLFTPKKNPLNRHAHVMQTPPAVREEREYRTPQTSGKYELGPIMQGPVVSQSAAPVADVNTASLQLHPPEQKRSLSFDPTLAGLELPRPHTVGSPSLTNKTGGIPHRLSLGLSSPVDSKAMSHSNFQYHSTTTSPLGDSHPEDPQQRDEFRVIPQLDTPLFSRDVSNRTASSGQETVEADHFSAYFEGNNQTPSKSQAYPASESIPEIEVDYDSYQHEYGEQPSGGQSTEVLFTPSRRGNHLQTVDTDAEVQEFADPLEVFTWDDREWHVYMSEQSYLYYLDLANSHSQWEDPRVHGFVSMSTYADLPPDSPAKLLDSFPPLSPALRSPSHISPSLTNSATKNRQVQESIDGGLNKIAKSFQNMFSFPDDEVQASRDGHEHPRDSLLIETDQQRTSGTLLLCEDSKSLGTKDRSRALSQDTLEIPSRAIIPARRDNDWIKRVGMDLDPEADSEKVGVIEERIHSKGAVFSTVAVDNKKESERLFAASEKSSCASNAQQAESIPLSSQNPSGDDAADIDLVQSYVDLIRGGKSLHDVRSQLESDGRSSKFIGKVLSLADDLLILDDEQLSEKPELSFSSPVPKSEKAKANEAIEATPAAVSLDSLKDDANYSKYVKMNKMGVPAMSVLSKMKLDNVAAEYVAVMQEALGLAPPKKADPVKDAKQSSKSWAPAPAERLKNSIWAFAVMDQPSESLLVEQELRELEQLFLAAPSAVSVDNSKNASTISNKPVFSLKLLEGRRAQNIAIGLVAFKQLGSHVDVIKAVCSLSDMDGKLSVDKIETFKTLLPTESEAKKSFLLKDVNHPAEIFVQTALIFYPELPFRLETFLNCFHFEQNASAVERKLKIIMDVINQVISSPKLTRILQKLLAISKVMMDPQSSSNKMKSKAADGKATVLEQLLQVCSTKGVDKKTSLLDYLVKSLHDKNDEGLLDVIDDLSPLADSTLPLSSSEALQDFEHLQKQLSAMQQEQHRVQPHDNVFSSPTAKAMSDEYCVALDQHVSAAKDRISLISKRKLLLSRKLRALMEYFGEDPRNTDTNAIFQALRDFRRALAFSKESVEWKLSRNA